MPTFEYVALDAKGRESTGRVDAPSQIEAIGSIRERGLFPTLVGETGGLGPARAGAGKRGAKMGSSSFPSWMEMEIAVPGLQRVSSKQLMTFTRQLATLLEAGLPLIRGLRVLQRQGRSTGLRNVLADMADAIESGFTFAEALSQHPRIFNRLYVNMVKAGEIGGILDVVLDRLAEFMEKAQKTRNKVQSAMVYPSMVLAMAIAILTFLLIFIIPRFEAIFQDMLGHNQGLPALTQFVLGVSRGAVTHWTYVLGTIAGAGFLLLLIQRTRTGKIAVDWLKFKLPLFGDLMLKTSISRFSRTLGTLMNAGVPVLQALSIVRDTSGNNVMARAIDQVHDAVKEGENMAGPIEAAQVFPPIVVSMVEVGEESGALSDMLLRIANTYDDEVDHAVAALTSLIEPILIVFLAVIVGTIVLALFLPLIEIIGELSG